MKHCRYNLSRDILGTRFTINHTYIYIKAFSWWCLSCAKYIYRESFLCFIVKRIPSISRVTILFYTTKRLKIPRFTSELLLVICFLNPVLKGGHKMYLFSYQKPQIEILWVKIVKFGFYLVLNEVSSRELLPILGFLLLNTKLLYIANVSATFFLFIKYKLYTQLKDQKKKETI